MACAAVRHVEAADDFVDPGVLDAVTPRRPHFLFDVGVPAEPVLRAHDKEVAVAEPRLGDLAARVPESDESEAGGELVS